MLFNSYIFLFLFLPLCLLAYFLCNRKVGYRAGLVVLSVMSLVFYAYDHIQYLLILVLSILVNWFISRIIIRLEERPSKIILMIGIVANILPLFYFKYLNFVLFNFNRIVATDFQIEQIILPLGISFYTFQQISYLVDTYRGETKKYNFLEYTAFVSFFPQLVAGPIVLHKEIIPQFRQIEKKKFNSDSLANGLYVLAVGLFKKVILADTFGEAVAWGFSHVADLSSMDIIIVMLSYTFQIYFDFSGYSDMAIGIARMFNIDIPRNFNSPYKATSIREFWDRWHMTLTRFLREYIYFPLGGSRKGRKRTYINIIIIYIVSGIWHGASWTFILWGIVHGIASVLNRIFKKTWERMHVAFQWLVTFCFLNISWLIFRADSVSQVFELLKRMIRLDKLEINRELMWCFSLNEFNYLKGIGFITGNVAGFWMWAFMAVALFICLNMTDVAEKKFKPTIGKALGTAAMLFWSIISLAGISTFLYFNF